MQIVVSRIPWVRLSKHTGEGERDPMMRAYDIDSMPMDCKRCWMSGLDCADLADTADNKLESDENVGHALVSKELQNERSSEGYN